MSSDTSGERARRDSDARRTQGAVLSTEQHNALANVRARDPDFWYEDGNIILVAGDVEFRVYRGILAQHSPFFNDMDTLPQPVAEGAPGSGDPCPAVECADSPIDLKYLLRALTPKTGISPFSPEMPSYHMLAAIIRLGHKYQMTELVDHAVRYLKASFPFKIDDWACPKGFVPPGFLPVHAIGVVNLARLTRHFSLLPTALFICACLGEELAHGFEGENGMREVLTPRDLGRCYTGALALAKESATMAIRVLLPQPPADGCTTPVACMHGLRTKWATLVYQGAFADRRMFAPFVRLLADDPGLACCPPCRAMARRREWENRRAVWKRLPAIMGLVPEGVVADLEGESEDIWNSVLAE